MQVKETKIHGAYEFLPDPFIDHRGTYVELFNQEQYVRSSWNLRRVI